MHMSTHDKRPNSLTQKDRARILSKVKKLVPTRHINVNHLNKDYEKWAALVEQRTPELIAAEDKTVFERGMRELLQALGSSHTAFYQKDGAKVPAPHSINASLRAVDCHLGTRWMFEDVVEDGPAAVAGIKSGDLLLSVDSASVVPPTAPSFSIGGRPSLPISSIT